MSAKLTQKKSQAGFYLPDTTRRKLRAIAKLKRWTISTTAEVAIEEFAARVREEESKLREAPIEQLASV